MGNKDTHARAGVRRTLVPDLVLDARGAHSGVCVTVENGRIVEVGSAIDGERLPSRALAPGFVNDHSHAFQRGLRGRVERLDPTRPHDDFWTWRERMYSLAESLDPESISRVSEDCFREMLSKAVAEAAEAAGLRMLLLPVAYVRGGISRFRDASLDAFLERVDELRGWAGGLPLIEVGLAAHSVRAVPREWLEGLGEYAANSGLPLHIHAGEQPREIEECKQEHGLRPVELLAKTGFLGSGTTIVHATHADAVELDLIASSESSICVCPTTEGNLGDGFLPAEGVLERRIRLSVGSDQHVRLDPFEELRELETNARRLAGRRNVLVASKENSPTPYLLRAGQQRKGLEPGALADFIEIDLSHPEILDVEPEYLPSALIFGAGREVVAASWVAGARAYGRDHE